jgi:hypothetical protein
VQRHFFFSTALPPSFLFIKQQQEMLTTRATPPPPLTSTLTNHRPNNHASLQGFQQQDCAPRVTKNTAWRRAPRAAFLPLGLATQHPHRATTFLLSYRTASLLFILQTTAGNVNNTSNAATTFNFHSDEPPHRDIFFFMLIAALGLNFFDGFFDGL